jgi:hypothetical protein
MYTAVFVCFPRVYVGYHFPSDILAGTVIGIAVTSLILQPTIRDLLAREPLRIFRARPAIFYVFAYLASLLLTTNFDLVRRGGAVVFRSLRMRNGM